LREAIESRRKTLLESDLDVANGRSVKDITGRLRDEKDSILAALVTGGTRESLRQPVLDEFILRLDLRGVDDDLVRWAYITLSERFPALN
jgi:hypothetical protein